MQRMVNLQNSLVDLTSDPVGLDLRRSEAVARVDLVDGRGLVLAQRLWLSGGISNTLRWAVELIDAGGATVATLARFNTEPSVADAFDVALAVLPPLV